MTLRLLRRFHFISNHPSSTVDTLPFRAIVSHKVVCYIQPRHAGVNQ